jgi:hypothetical protein
MNFLYSLVFLTFCWGRNFVLPWPGVLVLDAVVAGRVLFVDVASSWGIPISNIRDRFRELE